MSGNVEQIKERLSIADVVGSYLKLEKAGSNYKARCPFHNEKTPSFFVSPSRGSYYCFGCNAHGDIFSFIEQFEGLDFVGALKVLAAKAGVTLEKENPRIRSERERLYSALETAAIFFENDLAVHKDALAYLKKRGVSEATIKTWRLGFAPAEWRSLYVHLKKNGFTEDEMFKAGLIKKAERQVSGGNAPKIGYYDTFRGRIMFPIFDSSGRVIAFSGRILVDDGSSAKYLNTPETALFSKSRVLYGLDKAKMDIRKRDYSILVEGQMDLIMSHQTGFTNTVAVSGTALSSELVSADDALTNLGLLTRLSNNIIFCFDSDEAGFKASERSAKIALGLGMDVKIAKIPKDNDPADIILKDKDEWKKIIKDSRPVVDFYLEAAIQNKIDERALGKEIERRVLPFVAALKSSIDQSVYIGKIAKAAGIREEALWQELKKIPEGESSKTAVGKKAEEKAAQSRREMIEKKIMAIIFWQKGKENSGLPISEAEERFKKIAGENRYADLVSIFESIKNELIFEAEISHSDTANLSRELGELFANLEEEYLKEDFEKAMEELSIAERARDQGKAGEILSRCKGLSERINLLRNQRHSIDKT